VTRQLEIREPEPVDPAPTSAFVLMITDTQEDFDRQREKVHGSEFRMRRVTLEEVRTQVRGFQRRSWSSRSLGAALILGEMDDLSARAALLMARRMTTLPVVVLHASPDVQVTVELLNLGGNEVLPTHTPAAELLATLRSRRRRPHTRALDHGPLQVDPDLHVATLGGNPMDLTRKEMTLLSVFVSSPGQIRTHAELAGALWPGQTHVRTNRLEVMLSNLREKFRQAGIEQPYRRVRGMGVKLKDPEDLEAELPPDRRPD